MGCERTGQLGILSEERGVRWGDWQEKGAMEALKLKVIDRKEASVEGREK